MISAEHVNQEIPVLKEGEEVTLEQVYNALRVVAKLMLNVRTNQVRIGEKVGVKFETKKPKPSADTKE